MFNEGDVDSGPRVQGAREHRNESNPSRDTISPTSTDKSCWSIGPAYTNVWNSPFSPQGSISGGNSERSEIGAEFLFQVIAERAERAALIVTTNLPFSEWTQVFPNPRLCKALLDRITDRAHTYERAASGPPVTGEDYLRAIVSFPRGVTLILKRRHPLVGVRGTAPTLAKAPGKWRLLFYEAFPITQVSPLTAPYFASALPVSRRSNSLACDLTRYLGGGLAEILARLALFGRLVGADLSFLFQMISLALPFIGLSTLVCHADSLPQADDQNQTYGFQNCTTTALRLYLQGDGYQDEQVPMCRSWRC